MGEPECAGFEFFSNFDSANLAKVEYVPSNESAVTPASTSGRFTVEVPDVEFNIWTKPDCGGTEFENTNRTWFYFGIRANASGLLVKLNMVDLNRQAKMYSQGMAPVYRTIPGKVHWERIRDKPTYTLDENIFTLSFKYRTPDNIESITYFAFTYPYSFSELSNMLCNIDNRFLGVDLLSKDDIYYARETICYSLEGRNVDLLTISSYHNISNEREVRLRNLFPENLCPRPFTFIGKKVIFVSARVHPGETPSSFVMNGFINLLLSREDPVAITLRRLYVFKVIPMLNPDGVAKGHYRTDTRGVNLNRMYLNPSLTLHPSIFAARSLIRYHHFGYEKEEAKFEDTDELGNDEEEGSSIEDNRIPGYLSSNDNKLSKKVSHMTLEENNKNKKTEDADGNSKDSQIWCFKCKTNIIKYEDTMPGISNILPTFNHHGNALSSSTGKSGCCRNCGASTTSSFEHNLDNKCEEHHGDYNLNESGLFMYIDMHGHASKKGIFMYGNHFEDLDRNIECMLLPKIMSINNHNFHFTACNFTERNMYLKDRRDGMSREGSGRVAVLKLTGLVRSYTLECNYNTGRFVNALPSTIKEGSKTVHTLPVPPKYTPHVFEEVGRALGASILDLTSQNPITRLPNSQFHTLNGLREWLRVHCAHELGETRCTPTRFKLRNSASLHAQGKSIRAVVIKTRSTSAKGPKRISTTKTMMMRSTSVPIERKENIFDESQPGCSNTNTNNKNNNRNSIVPSSRSRPKSFSNVRNSKNSLKMKGSNAGPNEKSKSTTNIHHASNPRQKIKIDLTTKLQTIKEKQPKSKINRGDNEGGGENSSTSNNRLKLREICFVKGSEGKRMIAKYKTREGDSDSSKKEGSEDNLIVSWDSGNNPQVFSHKIKGPGLQNLRPLITDAGPSKMGAFRVHNFAKTTSAKLKRNKRPLRRLTTATDSPAKLDKLKKRKILKSQTT